MVIALLCIGCSNHEQHQHNEHSHSDKLKSVVYTLYSDKTELFVEFKPLIIGQTSRLAAHFTKLGKRFEPITEGTVRVSLVGPKKQPTNKADSPSSPGIFLLAIKPQNLGNYKIVFDIKTKDYTDKIVIDDVTVFPNEKFAIDNQKEDSENEITYLKEQAWKIEFANEVVQAQSFAEIIKTTGQILPAQGDEVVVIAKSNGTITFNNKKLIGSTVGKGENLFTISGKGFINEDNLETRYKIAKANYERTKIDYERAQELVKDKLISEKNLQERKAELKKTETVFNTLSNSFNTSGQKIKSPITGFIKNLMIQEGQYVEMGQPLASISQNRKLVLMADVPQKYFSKLNSIVSANFKTVYNDIIYNTETLNGKFVSYGKNASENTCYIPLYFEIDNKGELIPGSFIEIFLKTTASKNTLTIPRSALIEEQGSFFVYVQTSGEGFEKRELKLGANDGKRVQVLSGLKENERVVTKGGYQIKLATMSGTIPTHGHSH